MKIEFTEEYRTGIDEIDKQHETWVRMYNELYQMMDDGRYSMNSEKIIQIMKNLYAYTTYHFDYEEKMMEKIGYSDISNHRRSHKSMDGEIYRLYRMAMDKEFIALGTVVKIMINWILNHILIEDREYLSFYQHHSENKRSAS